MNWYKQSVQLNDFQDRNVLNHTVRFFQEVSDQLNHLRKYVFQNARDARKVILSISENKILSSYPQIREPLREGYNIALDNPGGFSRICVGVYHLVNRIIKGLKEDREEFIQKRLPAQRKKLYE
jgi:hypothetical protein